MLRRALFLAAVLVAPPVLAEAQVSIGPGKTGEGLVARNTGTESLVVSSGQLNYRDDCELTAVTWKLGTLPLTVLGDLDAETAYLKANFGADSVIKAELEVGPVTLRPGEDIGINANRTLCGSGNSTVIAILIRTDRGDFSFTAQ